MVVVGKTRSDWFVYLGSPLRHSCHRPSPTESPIITFRLRSPLLRARPPAAPRVSPTHERARVHLQSRREKHRDTRSHTYENMSVCERNGVCKERTCAIVRSGARRVPMHAAAALCLPRRAANERRRRRKMASGRGKVSTGARCHARGRVRGRLDASLLVDTILM